MLRAMMINAASSPGMPADAISNAPQEIRRRYIMASKKVFMLSL